MPLVAVGRVGPVDELERLPLSGGTVARWHGGTVARWVVARWVARRDAMCGVQYAVCSARFAMCGVQYAVRGMRYAVRNLRCAILRFNMPAGRPHVVEQAAYLYSPLACQLADRMWLNRLPTCTPR